MSGQPPEGAVPAGYAELLEALKARVRSTQVRAARAANTEVLRLYWSIGRDILDRQDQAGWGTGVVDQLATDLRLEFPDQRGRSRRNLLYMRAFAAAWPELGDVAPQPVAQLPWGHVRALLDRLDDRAARDWYAARAAAEGWSRAVLEFGVRSGLHTRVGAAPSNFTAQLPPAESNLAQALVRDPYVFDTLGLSAPIAERDLEQALRDRLQATLLEFGRGMAFVGRQVRFDVGDGDEVVVDLLLFNVEQLRYVVVELKVGRLGPGDLGPAGGVCRGRGGPAPPGRGPPCADGGAAAGRRAQRPARPVRPVRQLRAGRHRGLGVAARRDPGGAPAAGPARRGAGRLDAAGGGHRCLTVSCSCSPEQPPLLLGV